MDRLGNALKRLHEAELHNTTIEVYEPSESYTAGDGFTVTYPDTPDAQYSARVAAPASRADRTEGGTTAEIDAVVTVRDDTGQTWTDYTAEREAPVELVDTADGTRYEVEALVDSHNGIEELEVAET
jgi:hypothetical protein